MSLKHEPTIQTGNMALFLDKHPNRAVYDKRLSELCEEFEAKPVRKGYFTIFQSGDSMVFLDERDLSEKEILLNQSGWVQRQANETLADRDKRVYCVNPENMVS